MYFVHTKNYIQLDTWELTVDDWSKKNNSFVPVHFTDISNSLSTDEERWKLLAPFLFPIPCRHLQLLLRDTRNTLS